MFLVEGNFLTLRGGNYFLSRGIFCIKGAGGNDFLLRMDFFYFLLSFFLTLRRGGHISCQEWISTRGEGIVSC